MTLREYSAAVEGHRRAVELQQQLNAQLAAWIMSPWVKGGVRAQRLFRPRGAAKQQFHSREEYAAWVARQREREEAREAREEAQRVKTKRGGLFSRLRGRGAS